MSMTIDLGIPGTKWDGTNGEEVEAEVRIGGLGNVYQMEKEFLLAIVDKNFKLADELFMAIRPLYFEFQFTPTDLSYETIACALLLFCLKTLPSSLAHMNTHTPSYPCMEYALACVSLSENGDWDPSVRDFTQYQTNIPFFNALSEFVRRLYVRRLSLLSKVVKGEIKASTMADLTAVPQAAGCDVENVIGEARWRKEEGDKWVYTGELNKEEDPIMDQPGKVDNITERFAKILGSVGEMV